MEKYTVIAVHVTDRVKHVSNLQKTLSKYACYIKTRIGLHEASHEICSVNGVILLHMVRNPEKVKGLVADLKKITGLVVKKIAF